jgi:sugar phosphate isomerase/epimerase
MITEYAATKGVRTCTENHGMICQDADRVEKIINKVNNPNFGWLVDIGNFMCTNGDCAKSVEIGSKYVFHVHVKDFHTFDAPCDGAFATAEKKQYIQGAIVGEGVVPVKECIDILKNKGYNDYFTIEFEGLEDCVEALKKGMEFIKSCE